MAILVDTSVWVHLFRDKSGVVQGRLRALLEGEQVYLSRFVMLELLQGASDEREWALLDSYLATQDYLEMASDDWIESGRIYFELRRAGLTVRSPIDCCIARLAVAHDALLLHRDRDFEAVARIRPLRHRWLD